VLSAYHSKASFGKAIEHHAKDLAIAKDLGDRAGEGMSYGNLGNAYQSQGDFDKAIKYHTQRLSIAKEFGAGISGMRITRRGTSARRSSATRSACRSQRSWATGRGRAEHTGAWALATCTWERNDKAVAYHQAQHDMATELRLASMQARAALGMGIALSLHVQADCRGPAAGASQAHGLHSHSSAGSACLHDECVGRQSGSRLPSMVVIILHDCTWRTSHLMRALA
jgi:tetratricopeptide (TPR) repeat protein